MMAIGTGETPVLLALLPRPGGPPVAQPLGGTRGTLRLFIFVFLSIFVFHDRGNWRQNRRNATGRLTQCVCSGRVGRCSLSVGQLHVPPQKAGPVTFDKQPSFVEVARLSLQIGRG